MRQPRLELAYPIRVGTSLAGLERVFYDAGVTDPTWTDDPDSQGSTPVGPADDAVIGDPGSFADHLAQSEPESAAHKPKRRRHQGNGRAIPYGNVLTSASPFKRLAATHALSVAGDALFTVALADSIFFSTEPDQARFKVALSLALTMAPFAIVSPFLGPVLDRFAGGRKAMVVGSLVLRALMCLMLAGIVEHPDNLGLYPLAFIALVLSKAYAVSKSSLVPSAVSHDDDLVLANARLAMIAGIFGALALIPGVGLSVLFGGDWVLRFAVIAYVVGALVSLRVIQRPVVRGLNDPTTPVRSTAVITAAVAMGAMRFSVGFLAFLIAFEYREDGALVIGLALGASAVGTFVGNFIVPKFDNEFPKERIIEVCLGATAVACLFGALVAGTVAAVVLAFCIGLTAAGTRLAFDALVQRDCPDEMRARFFAKFEAAFQVAWVVGAIVPVLINFSLVAGFSLLMIVVAAMGAAYVLGRQRVERKAAMGESVDATLVGAYPEIEQVRRGVRQAVIKAQAQRRAKRDALARAAAEAQAGRDELAQLGHSSTGAHVGNDVDLDEIDSAEAIKTVEQRSLFERGSSADTDKSS